MNKHKKNLEYLRRHLGRDTAGLKLLDDVARDLSEQRKRLAELEESESRACARADSHRKELDHAKTQITKLQEEVAREQAKRIAADHREKRAADRIAAMESDVEAEDEVSGGPENELGGVWKSRLLTLSKDLRRRYKRLPKLRNKSINLDDVIVNYTRDEFASLGMLMAFTALFLNDSPHVRCERSLEAKGGKLSDKALGRIVHWMGAWIGTSPTQDMIYDACWGPGKPRRAKRSRVEVEE